MTEELYWCSDCSSLSIGGNSRSVYAYCRRSRGDRGVSQCGGVLREPRGHQALVDAIMAAYRLNGWGAAVDVWREAGYPRL